MDWRRWRMRGLALAISLTAVCGETHSDHEHVHSGAQKPTRTDARSVAMESPSGALVFSDKVI